MITAPPDTAWRPHAAAWWSSPAWHAYEALHDGPPGTRSRLLATATWQTRILDLSPSEAELWTGLRKSYKALINGANRQLNFRLATDTEIARVLHLRCAGRVTRPLATWQLMTDWLAAGAGLLVLAYDGAAPLAFAYAIRHADWSYYASGASVDDDLQHAVIWHALMALKARGVRWAELGWRGQAQDPKGQSIEHFRGGFGGRDEPARLT